MPTQIDIPDELFAKLQQHAVPFVDTPLTVIEKALEALAAANGSALIDRPAEPHVRAFNPAAAPDLAFTTVTAAKIGGTMLPKSKTYWNTVMYALIDEAAKRGHSKSEIEALVTVNHVDGVKYDSGYKFVEAAGLSLQGQDSNAAWKQAYQIASAFGIALCVEFYWPDEPKAAMPNTAGSFAIDGK